MIYVLSTFLDPLVFLLVLLAPYSAPPAAESRRREVGPRRLLLALVPTAAVFLARTVLLGLPGGFFAVLNVLYLEIVLAVPLAGMGCLAAGALPGPWRLSREVLAVAVLGVLPAPAGIWASFVEPYRLELERAEVVVPAQRAGNAEITIGILADLQTDRITDHERRAIRILQAEKPDIVLLPGDLFQGSRAQFERELGALRELLGELEAPGGVFFVTGNTDRDLTELRLAVQGSAVRILENEVQEVRVADRRVRILGLDAKASHSGTHRLQREFEKESGDDDIRILLGHYPDMLLELAPSSRIDLVVAGHTHGGQICLPWVGPPLTLTRVPRRIAAGGLHELDGRTIYVSRGVGMERAQAPRIRFLCRPEVSLLTVR